MTNTTIRESVRIEMAKTARAGGAVGSKAIVPRLVETSSPDFMGHTLDFGCGSEQLHVKRLRDKGFDVVGYDYEVNPELIEDEETFDTIYMSNVLNVQPSEETLHKTLVQVKHFMTPTSVLFANYPSSPRKAGLYVRDIEAILEEHFEEVTRLKGDKVGSNVVWCIMGALQWVDPRDEAIAELMSLCDRAEDCYTFEELGTIEADVENIQWTFQDDDELYDFADEILCRIHKQGIVIERREYRW